MESQEVMEQFPSICYTCSKARKPASIENREKGWVGCSLRVIGVCGPHSSICFDVDEIGEAKELAEGWVDLRSRVFSDKSSGVISNYQILTLGVNSCRQYDELI